MIELNIVKEQYARMGDEELQFFAINESDKLTIESFHLLREEFRKRNLELGIIESAEIDKALNDLNKQSTFEKITAYQFAESLFQYALDEKELGKPDFEIYNNLLDKGVDKEYAFMLVKSLGTISKEIADDYDSEIIAGWIFLIAGVLTIFLAFTGIFASIFILYGFIGLSGGGVRLYKSYSKKGKYHTISQNIEVEKTNNNIEKDKIKMN
jgi:hypothetical protein